MHLRLLCSTVLLLAACGTSSSEPASSSSPEPEPGSASVSVSLAISATVRSAEAPPCAPRSAIPLFRSLDTSGSGSAVVLARAGDRALALVADDDSSAIHTVDLDAR